MANLGPHTQDQGPKNLTPSPGNILAEGEVLSEETGFMQLNLISCMPQNQKTEKQL